MSAFLTRWIDDIATLSPRANPDDTTATGTELLSRWNEPQRRYHGLRHLTEMVRALEALRDAGELSSREAAVGRVAAWLHDAVYDPAAATGANESASAELAETSLTTLRFPLATLVEVVGLVEMTADHRVRGDRSLERAFHDADLWVLAAPLERFDEYCRQVREEYASVPDEVFGPARAAVLRGLLDTGGLYLTEYARQHWEKPARANLDRELARLARQVRGTGADPAGLPSAGPG